MKGSIWISSSLPNWFGLLTCFHPSEHHAIPTSSCNVRPCSLQLVSGLVLGEMQLFAEKMFGAVHKMNH